MGDKGDEGRGLARQGGATGVDETFNGGRETARDFDR